MRLLENLDPRLQLVLLFKQTLQGLRNLLLFLFLIEYEVSEGGELLDEGTRIFYEGHLFDELFFLLARCRGRRELLLELLNTFVNKFDLVVGWVNLFLNLDLLILSLSNFFINIFDN